MKRTRGWDPTVFVTWSLVAFSLCITMWQGWNCTMRYLSNPVTIEDSYESLSSLPPIQLSICKRFLIWEPLIEDLSVEAGFYPMVEDSVPDNSIPRGTILTFANSSEEFWHDMVTRKEYFRL
jgi:hypothetical protein